MAAMAENRMNLAALQQRDPYITGIVDTASQVALYSFNAQSNEWEKTEVEGTLFVYTRSASPINGFMILNRLGLNDMIEPINKNLEFQLQDPFLLYRNGQASICGVWFYDKDECARIGQLMNSLVQIAIDSQEHQGNPPSLHSRRERRASESEIQLEQRPKSSSGATGGDDVGAVAMNGGVVGAMNVDIMQMLTKAQDEYDQNIIVKVPGKRSAPKPMIDNPNAAATKSTNIIKPLALKPGNNQGDGEEHDLAIPATHISIDTLFKQATTENKQPQSAQILPPNQMPPLLQRLMSQPGSFLEVIERNQRSEILRDDMPKPAGAESAPAPSANGAAVPKLASPPKTVQAVWNDPEPESPNTALRRTLNLLPNNSSPSHMSSFTDSKIKGSNNKSGIANNRTSPGFPGLRRNTSGNNKDNMTTGRTTNQVTSSRKTEDTQLQHLKDSKFTAPPPHHQQSHHHHHPPPQHGSLFGTGGGLPSTGANKQVKCEAPAADGGGGPDVGVFYLHHQQPQQLNKGASLISGINPLQQQPQDDSIHTQLKQLTISDQSVFSDKDSTGSKSDVISDWLAGTSPLKGAALVTPQALVGGGQATSNTAPRSLNSISSQVCASPLQNSGSVLLTPMAFETARVTPPGSGNSQSLPVQCLVDSDSGSQKSSSPLNVEKAGKEAVSDSSINPLTKQQLQQALIHMLKNDADFISSIHEAYVKSLQLSLRNDRK